MDWKLIAYFSSDILYCELLLEVSRDYVLRFKPVIVRGSLVVPKGVLVQSHFCLELFHSLLIDRRWCMRNRKNVSLRHWVCSLHRLVHICLDCLVCFKSNYWIFFSFPHFVFDSNYRLTSLLNFSFGYISWLLCLLFLEPGVTDVFFLYNKDSLLTSLCLDINAFLCGRGSAAIESSPNFPLPNFLLLLSIVHVVLNIKYFIVKLSLNCSLSLNSYWGSFSQNDGRLTAWEFMCLDRLVRSWENGTTRRE